MCEPFGEVEVSESATITLADVPIDSADPANTFPEGVIEGLLEVLVPHEPIFQRFVEARGENELRAVAARHVDRLRESLVTAIHRAMSSTHGSA